MQGQTPKPVHRCESEQSAGFGPVEAGKKKAEKSVYSFA